MSLFRAGDVPLIIVAFRHAWFVDFLRGVLRQKVVGIVPVAWLHPWIEER